LAPRAVEPGQAKPPPPPEKAAPPPVTTEPLFGPDGIFANGTEVLRIDLPTALRIADSANPTIAFARAQIDEAYARVEQAQLKWIPDFDVGVIYLRHDGNIQNSAGVVFDTSKSNLTLFGGPTLRVWTSDALFAPLVARRLAAAQEAATRALTNNVQLSVALAYLDLLQAYGQLAVNADLLARDKEILRLTEVADRAELVKTKADPVRMRTEYELRLQERINLRGQVRVTSSRLARLLLLQPGVGLVPADPALVPITLIPEDRPLDELIGQALANRPELAESQALIAASQARLRQSRLDPLLPRVELTYYGADFGGGRNTFVGDFRSRGDGTAAAVWELKNLGLGNLAENRVRAAQLNQANLHGLDVQAQVADEVNQAVQVALARREALGSAQEAIRNAVEMFRRLDVVARNMIDSRTKGLESIEPLLAIQTLAQARSQYLHYVIDYNRAQFQLFAAVGSPPIEAPPQAAPVPLEVTPVPLTYVPPKN
jgi:outer membrane protein TolC